jgi:GDP-L-fucose synthase
MSGGDPSRPNPAFWDGKSVAVTGGGGFLGKPVMRMLEDAGADATAIRSAEFDLTDKGATLEALRGAEVVLHLAANVGGIGYNRRNPAPLVRDNLAMGLNVFDASRELGVQKLIAACSVCAYPLHTPVPFREETIWDGYPEPSNAPYGLAKKMLIVLSDTYRRQYGFDSCAPVIANLYGPDDNFDLDDSHVIAAMVRKYVEAAADGHRDVTLWGSGEPSREFLYVDDAARGLILCAERLEVSDPVNLGVGRETRIRDLAEAIAGAAGFRGETVWDASMPDGQMKRGLDVSKAKELIGFEAEVALEQGIRRTVEWFREHEMEGAEA